MKCALCYKTKTSARFDTSKVEDTDNQLQLGPNNQMLDPIGQDSGPILEWQSVLRHIKKIKLNPKSVQLISSAGNAPSVHSLSSVWFCYC